MKKLLKWLCIISTLFFVLITAAVFILPQFINVQKYKPIIEQKVMEATGRSFTLGDEIDLSIFPWVGVKLTDLHLGNPSGYKAKDMISVKNFEVRLKVMPLLSKRIEVKTFVLDTPVIYLEKLKNGDANWQGLGKQQKTTTPEEQAQKKPANDLKIPIESLIVENFSITNGELLYVDQATDVKKRISDLNFNLADITLDHPVKIAFSAKVDEKPISLDGTAGPIGKEPGKETINFDFVVKALEELEIKLNGHIIEPLASQTLDLELNVSSFSPRQLLAALNLDLPVQPKDPKVLEIVACQARLKGNTETISLSDGLLSLDDSQFNFQALVKEFSKPNLKFDLKLDEIDIDRYLPAPPTKEESPQSDTPHPEKTTSPESAEKSIDYGPLRKLILDGNIKVGKLKARGATMENIAIHLLAKNGIITIDPLLLDLYQGNVASKVELNVQKNNPKTKMTLDMSGIQAERLIKDAMQKELIAGTLKTNLVLSMTGEKPEMIKQTLTGKGEIAFNDGAIIGIDLANAVRNIKVDLGMIEKPKEKPRTDFAELKIPFTVKNGLVHTNGISLVSPLLRLLATGDVNLVKDLLDLRVDPKFVATLKGQGDTEKRSGLMVPVLITGSFSSPKIRPDLESMLSNGDAILDAKGLKEGVLGTKEDRKKNVETLKKDVKQQLKGLLPGLLN